MMTRLNRYMRDEIKERAVKAALKDRKAEIVKRADYLARKTYKTIFKPKVLAIIEKVPDDWLKRVSTLPINVCGMVVNLELIGDSLPIPNKILGSYDRVGAIGEGPLADEIRVYLSDVQKLRQDEVRMREALRPLLNSCTTIKALRAAWPEGEPYFGLIEAKQPVKLPALIVADINAILGLKPIVKEASP